MDIDNIFSAFSNANSEINNLRERISAFEKEREAIATVRKRLQAAENRMLQAYEAYQNVTVKTAHRTANRYKENSSINIVLTVIREHGTWIHRRDLVDLINKKGYRTSHRNRFNEGNVSTCLSVLKKEGQVHNHPELDGRWRYGKGERIWDTVPRG